MRKPLLTLAVLTLGACAPPEHDCVTPKTIYVRGTQDCAWVGRIQDAVEAAAREISLVSEVRFDTLTLEGTGVRIEVTEDGKVHPYTDVSVWSYAQHAIMSGEIDWVIAGVRIGVSERQSTGLIAHEMFHLLASTAQVKEARSKCAPDDRLCLDAAAHVGWETQLDPAIFRIHAEISSAP